MVKTPTPWGEGAENQICREQQAQVGPFIRAAGALVGIRENKIFQGHRELKAVPRRVTRRTGGGQQTAPLEKKLRVKVEQGET